MLALNDIETGLIQNVTGDLLALDIRQALHYLGTITGKLPTKINWILYFLNFVLESKLAYIDSPSTNFASTVSSDKVFPPLIFASICTNANLPNS